MSVITPHSSQIRTTPPITETLSLRASAESLRQLTQHFLLCLGKTSRAIFAINQDTPFSVYPSGYRTTSH
ncbi:hypothetical protein Rhal01_01759 [Rubritalea halochordaticola]|uniref:Uncharacterized protein n=1 Tax=Rubritalea halochordaticola TaxID=714537 RepID=A0ABP9V0T9_9BACT